MYVSCLKIVLPKNQLLNCKFIFIMCKKVHIARNENMYRCFVVVVVLSEFWHKQDKTLNNRYFPVTIYSIQLFNIRHSCNSNKSLKLHTKKLHTLKR